MQYTNTHRQGTAGLHPRNPVIIHENLLRDSHKPYCPPVPFTWLQLLLKQTNTGISSALTAQIHRSTRKRLRALTDLWQPRLADVTIAWSWRLCGINPAIATDKVVLHNVNSKGALVNTMTAYNNNDNNNIYLLQLGCYPVAVVILHVNKTWNWLLLNLSPEGYMRSM